MNVPGNLSHKSCIGLIVSCLFSFSDPQICYLTLPGPSLGGGKGRGEGGGEEEVEVVEERLARREIEKEGIEGEAVDRNR